MAEVGLRERPLEGVVGVFFPLNVERLEVGVVRLDGVVGVRRGFGVEEALVALRRG